MTDDERAESAIERLSEPPKERFRTLLVLALVSLLAVGVAVVVLSFVVSALRGDRAEDQATLDCRNLYTAEITAAQQVASDASTQVIIEIARSLISPDATPESKRAAIDAAIQIADLAQARNAAAIAARSQWVANGSPLPCPTP